MTNVRYTPDMPNAQEVTKTALPLLSTVLAGFAVTISAQLAILPGASQGAVHPRHLLAAVVIILACSVPFFLAAATFAVWGQGYSYIILTGDNWVILGVDEKLRNDTIKWADYLNKCHRAWLCWHRAAINAYQLGLIVFCGGVVAFLNDLIGVLAGILFGVVASLCLIGGLVIASKTR
jgi:hypothetical protein